MDARFRRICAVFAGGRCLIARGYEADARLRSALLALRQSGAIPSAVAEEPATLEEIAECWRAAGAASSPAAGEAAARRIKRLFEDAAAARASDVVFETGGGACHVFAIVHDRKLQLAEPMTAEEGREAAGFLFHCKDEGSSQTSYRRGSFQGFSIRAGGQVPLPAGISALRCQRGPPRARRRSPVRAHVLCRPARCRHDPGAASVSRQPKPPCLPGSAWRPMAASSSAAPRATASRPHWPSISPCRWRSSAASSIS